MILKISFKLMIYSLMNGKKSFTGSWNIVNILH